jgi:integrase
MQIRHLDLEKGTLRVDQRSWHKDVGRTKTAKSRRTLAVALLADRYRSWIQRLPDTNPNAWLFPQKGDTLKPMWDSGMREELHAAAAAVGCDFPGLGPHSLRRANITWGQADPASR